MRSFVVPSAAVRPHPAAPPAREARATSASRSTFGRSSRFAVPMLLAPSLALSLASCSAFETNVQDAAIEEKDTARQNFEAAEAAFQAARWQEAVKYFELVKNKFPYSKYAVLAELRLADTHFEREKWLEAASSYRIFVRFHPRHEQVAYAAWRVALAHSRAIEDNVAWLPFVDAREKDQSAAVDTIKACDDFLLRFPTDEHAAEVRALRVTARGRLADVDLYAASFYESRGKWQGARWRYERVANEFAETPRAAFALWRGGQIALDHFNDAASARASWQRLVREHSDAPEAADAKDALERLANTVPSPPAASTTPATTPTSAAREEGPTGAPTGLVDPAEGTPDSGSPPPPPGASEQQGSAGDASDDGTG